MELKQLRYFAAIAQSGSMTQAADKLNIAQPALSRSMKKLETELNCSLMIRHERGISLTESGEQLLIHARQLLAQADDAKAAIASIQDLQQGKVRIGIPTMLGSYFFPPLLMAFHHRYPGLALEIVDAGSVTIRQMLSRGELDLGIIAEEESCAELTTQPILNEEMVCCMATDHPLTQFTHIHPEQFLQYEQIGFHAGFFHQRFIDQFSRQSKRSPHKIMTTNLMPLIKTVVRQGFAISILLKLVIQPEDGIEIRSFAPPELIHLHLAWHNQRYLSRANQIFRDFLLEELR